MSIDPRELNTEAQKLRREHQRELEKHKKGQAAGEATQGKKETQPKETSKKPIQEQTRPSETDFQSDIKDNNPAADEARKKDVVIRETQKRRGLESTQRIRESEKNLKRRTQKTAADILSYEPETEIRAATEETYIAPKTRPKAFIDAKGASEQNIGTRAAKQIESTNPRAYEGYTRARQEQAFDKYEDLFSTTQRLRAKASELAYEAREPLAEGKPADILQLTASAGLRFTAEAADAFTFPIRPGLWARTLVSGTRALTPRGAAQLIQGIAEDPTGALFGVAGGAGAGVIIGGAYGLTKPTGKQLRSKYEIEDQLPFENELGLNYPQSETLQKTSFIGFEKVKDAGYVDDFMSTRLMPRGKFPKSGYKAFGRTGGDLVPVQVLDDSRLMPVYKPIIDIETAPTYTPGIRNLPTPIGTSTRITTLGLIGAGASLIDKTKPKLDTTPETIPLTDPISRTKPRGKQRDRVKDIFNTTPDTKPKNIIDTRPDTFTDPVTRDTSRSISRSVTKQKSPLEVSQKQVQRNILDILPPERSSRPSRRSVDPFGLPPLGRTKRKPRGRVRDPFGFEDRAYKLPSLFGEPKKKKKKPFRI